MDGGATQYTPIAAGVTLTLDIPSLGGGPQNITFWAATSATSGRVGDITFFDCYSNGVTSLDVSNATAIDYLVCSYNNLTSLDLSTNTALTYANCQNNNLTSLNLNGATALTSLTCSDNNLTSLDLSTNTALRYLYAPNNPLTGHFDASGISTGFTGIIVSLSLIHI